MLRAIWETARGVVTIGSYAGSFPLASFGLGRALRRGGRAAAIPIQRRRALRACALGGIDWEVDGEDNLPDGPYVIVHNESSLVDLLVIHGLLLTDYADLTMGAAMWRFIPGAVTSAEAMGIRMFRRGNREESTRLLDELTEHVRAGGRVSMSGEGRLSRDGEVHHFKRGGALIAIRAGAPLVPVCLQGGFEICRTGTLRVRPGTIRVRFGPPLDTTGLHEADAPDLAAKAERVVSALYDAARAGAR